MALPIVWSGLARQRLMQITDYISERDVGAAGRLLERMDSATLKLSEYPDLFRPGRVKGTRECVVHTNYILIYRVLPDAIEVANILHSRQKYP